MLIDRNALHQLCHEQMKKLHRHELIKDIHQKFWSCHIKNVGCELKELYLKPELRT